MKRRILYPMGYVGWIGTAFLVSPYLLAASAAIDYGVWWWFLLAPALSYVFYATCCHRASARVIAIGNGLICESPSYTPLDPIQHRVKVPLSQIVIADFSYVQGDSRGNQNDAWGNPIPHAWDLPCLALTLEDESVERIVLCGYSKQQIQEIEDLLSKLNKNILFDHRASFLTGK